MASPRARRRATRSAGAITSADFAFSARAANRSPTTRRPLRAISGQAQVPAQFAFTGKAVGTLVGVATGLAPDFNFIDVATPYARKFLGLNAENIGQTLQQILTQLLETMNTFLKMPRTIERILTKLEEGQFVINLGGDLRVGATAFRRRERDNANSAFPFALALMFVASLGGAYLFDHANDHILAIVSLGLAGILGLRLFLRW